MDNHIIAQLESRIEALIQLCDSLNTENRVLRDKDRLWVTEKSRLIKTNQTAACKIESMINRLKTLEHNE